nr:MAG TPA: hypothetical protein [Caudoviricetes sp.]
MFVFALTLHCRTLQVQIYGIIRETNKKNTEKSVLIFSIANI